MAPIKLVDWESHLVVRAQAGELVAFELLADLHRDSLKSLAMRWLHNREDANDAVQEALLKGFKAIQQFKPGRPVLPWFSRICVNCCVDIIRQRKGGTEPIEKYEFSLPSSSDTDMEIDQVIDDEEIRRVVAKLPKHYREIVEMRHFRDMDVAEIAKAVNRPEGTVKSWLFRARIQLRRDLEPMLIA